MAAARDAQPMTRRAKAQAGSNVIWVDFRAGRQTDDWCTLMAERCDDEARRATPRVAASLKRLAKAYRAKAAGG